MAAFTAVQPIADTFLFFLPFYYSAKLAFACYLWANNLAGAQLVYTKYVQPSVTIYEPLLDSKIAEIRALVSEASSTALARGVQWLQQKMVAALAHTHNAAASTLKAEPAGEAAPAAETLRSTSFASASFRSASSGLSERLRSFSVPKDD